MLTLLIIAFVTGTPLVAFGSKGKGILYLWARADGLKRSSGLHDLSGPTYNPLTWEREGRYSGRTFAGR